ncbi:uncharacterized protein LOC119079429 [Bradysia coprophila]|uniref:uncharacterized protein LOC119079429 n=1 Tax=Bradysia coprophila TaxID=38358 RepID=UPI00187DB648|nr:uncharacterized protein LOC119079429 [Bradysia coprophila]
MKRYKWCTRSTKLLKLQTFVSMNIDCMQLIFEHLEWKDLVNVAETCKSFNEAVCAVFKRKYSGHNIVALGSPEKSTTPCNLIVISQPMIFKVLRNFGHTISNLHVYMSVTIWHADLLLYVNEYCYESMEKILFYRCKFEPLEWRKPFRNVQTLKMFECQFSDQPATFTSDHFPNLKHLKLKENSYYNSQIVQHMQQLLRLSFTPQRQSQLKTPTIPNEDDIIELIKINPQVEVLHLSIFEHHGHGILQWISKHLKSLRKLTLSVQDETVFQKNQELLEFDNIEDFHLLIYENAVLSTNPFVFKKLKSFTATNWCFNEKCTIDFIDKNNCITSFDINFESIKIDALVAKNILQNVEEFRLNYVENVPLIQILDISKQNFRLKKFLISGDVAQSYQAICNAITTHGFEIKLKKSKRVKGFRSVGKIFIKVLELSVRNSHNFLVKQSVLEVIDEGTQDSSIRWYSDKSAIVRFKKSVRPLKLSSYFFTQLD